MDGAALHRSTAAAVRFRGDAGASVVEYAVLLGLVAVVCIVAINYLGDAASKSLSTSADQLDGTAPAAVVVTTAPPTTVSDED
jgi:Flp pilus assembly pilin Flp